MKYIKEVKIVGLHGRKEAKLKLNSGLNIIHGKNGTGKTTFLHVIANLLEGDIERFCHLAFHEIQIASSEGKKIQIKQLNENGQTFVQVDFDKSSLTIKKGERVPLELENYIKDSFGGRPVYLPAFRSILEEVSRSTGQDRYIRGAIGRDNAAFSTPDEEREQQILIEKLEKENAENARNQVLTYRTTRERVSNVFAKTLLCRKWFGQFVPIIRYPSLNEVYDQIVAEMRVADLEVAKNDQDALVKVFAEVIKIILKPTDDKIFQNEDEVLAKLQNNLSIISRDQQETRSIYQEISSILKTIDPNDYSVKSGGKISPVLEIYNNVLENRIEVQNHALKNLKILESSINKFLEGKEIKIGINFRKQDINFIIFSDGKKSSFNVLSSGERHIVTLLFSVTHMSNTKGIVLVDEPELSLHIDWQKIILRELMSQIKQKQVLVCTHSPDVISDYFEHLIEIKPKKWTPSLQDQDQIDRILLQEEF